MDDPVEAIERAMVNIRRLQQRRTLAKVSGTPIDPTVTSVVDAVEQHAPCPVATIATALGVDQPRASRLVARAVDEGFVRRDADQDDGRKTVLNLTRSGATHAAQVHRFRQARFAAAMDGWSPQQVATFARLLTRFVDSYADLTYR
jgi:DNA-binding MarR family transcriptional regulator